MSTPLAHDGLTPKQEAAILALMNEPTVTRAAETVGVDARSIYRWLEDATFAAAFRRTRREAFAQAMSTTQKYAGLAVHSLAKVMSDANANPQARVAAATALLKFSRESLEIDSLVERIEQLEGEVAAKPKRVTNDAVVNTTASESAPTTASPDATQA
ncbi:MAG TPA: hypothetical protein VK157_11410 [Phycisphaerales bacterium]|nr:hypothetical protein [Phycisphaerales bacterium]